jgi:TonB family protein
MNHFHAKLGVIFLLVLCGIPSLDCAQIQIQQPPPVPTFGLGLEILTPHKGSDFTAFSSHWLQAVKRKWFEKMPESARMGDKGRVVVRLEVEKDGALLDQEVTLETSSGRKGLDKAAVAAIRAAAPFEHLPESFAGPNVELRCEFMYNLPPQKP